MFESRSTSAGYRFPLPSRPKNSEFHKTCVPAEARPKPAVAASPTQTGGPRKEADYAKCDAVTQDEIWKQSVAIEERGVRQWDQNWGFLTEYDSKGRPKSAKEIPTEVNMFSENVPNTNAGNYGSRLNTELGQTMQNMEFQFNAGRRKKKLGNDLICY